MHHLNSPFSSLCQSCIPLLVVVNILLSKKHLLVSVPLSFFFSDMSGYERGRKSKGFTSLFRFCVVCRLEPLFHLQERSEEIDWRKTKELEPKSPLSIRYLSLLLFLPLSGEKQGEEREDLFPSSEREGTYRSFLPRPSFTSTGMKEKNYNDMSMFYHRKFVLRTFSSFLFFLPSRL